MKWFIIAIVYFQGVVEPTYLVSNYHFESKSACQQYYINDRRVKDAVMDKYPTQKGHTLACVSNVDLHMASAPTRMANIYMTKG